MAKKAAAKKTAPKSKNKVRVLSTALFIGVVKSYEEDGKKHILGGKTYPAGTIVIPQMQEAYEESAALVGGTTPFDSFCIEVVPAATAPIEVEAPEDDA